MATLDTLARMFFDRVDQSADVVVERVERNGRWEPLVGAVTVPIYPTFTDEQVAYVMRDAGARALFVENRETLDRVLGLRDRIVSPRVRQGAWRRLTVETHDRVADLGPAAASFAANGVHPNR